MTSETVPAGKDPVEYIRERFEAELARVTSGLDFFAQEYRGAA